MYRNCRIAPETTCGNIVPDSCVDITQDLTDSCYEIQGVTCYRQSDFNEITKNLVCALVSDVEEIQENIDLTDLSACDPLINPVGQTVKQEFQNVYNALCALQTDLNIPLNGLNLSCLQDVCGEPIGTLGQLLQSLINQSCDSANTPKVYRANLTQTGTSSPVATVFENSIGNIVWSRTGVGTYVGSLIGAFTTNKVFLLVGSTPGTTVTITRLNLNQVQITTSADADLIETSVEIRIYL